jgi:hypothetical protein
MSSKNVRKGGTFPPGILSYYQCMFLKRICLRVLLGRHKELFFCHHVIGELVGMIGGNGKMPGK